MKKLTILLFSILYLGLIGCSEEKTELELDYYISDGKFYLGGGFEIPAECIGNLMQELNGDNNVASIYVSRCGGSNVKYLSTVEPMVEGDITYTITKELKNHKYRVDVCQKVYGSMGGYCDEIIVQFNTRDYEKFGFDVKNVLILDKIGDWE